MTKIALVTGAANGLGRVICERLIKAGYQVAVTDVTASLAAAAAAEIEPAGSRTLALGLDVTRKNEFEAALAALGAHWGTPSLLVNNAAMTMVTPLMQISAEEFDRVVAVNLRGTFLGCQVFGAAMAAAGSGRIVNLASLAGQNGGTATGGHYAASKGGILTLTKVFARELAAAGVTVNAIAPGPLELPSVRAAVPPERLEKMIAELIPMRHLGNPQFVADLIIQLASPEAAFVTGATWDVNGGLFMR